MKRFLGLSLVAMMAMTVLLDRLMRHDPYPPITEVLETSMVVRKSTQKPIKPQEI